MTRSSDSTADGDRQDLDLDLFGIVCRRYHLIAVGILVGATLAIIYYQQQVPVYESELSVLVGQRSTELTNTGTSNSTEQSNAVQEEILATHMELFGSRKIVEQAIADAKLGISYDDLEENLEISKGGEGLAKSASVLKAIFQDPDPDFAADTLQAIYESYQHYIESESRDVGVEAAELIAKSQVENEKALREADAEYRRFIASVPALVTTDRFGRDELQDVHRIRLNNIETELDKVRSELADARSRRTSIRNFSRGKSVKSINDVDVMTLMNEEEVTRLRAFVEIASSRDGERNDEERSSAIAMESTKAEYQKLLELTSQYSVMKAEFGSRHPNVATLKSEIRNVQDYVRRSRAMQPQHSRVDATPGEILARHYASLKNDIAELEKREDELIAQSEEEAKLAKDVEMTYLQGTSLKANLERAQQRYDLVFERLQEINLTNDYSGFSTDLIVMPLPAEEPVWPAKIMIAAFGLLGGSMLGLSLAMMAEFTDRTFKNPKEVEKVVAAPVLVHIPRLTPARKKLVKHSTIAPMVASFFSPQSSESETFRVLRTSVLLLTKGKAKQVFQITSPSPSNGKSTIAANLAVSMAQTGKRVLLVDTDMRRPTVSDNLGVEESPGLSDYLVGDELFEDCKHACDQANLFVCPAGSSTSQPSELLETKRFVSFLNEARRAFDIVFVDAPPLLAVTDPAIIAGAVDSVLLAIRIEKNNRTLVERATEILREQGAPLDGVIVNSRDSNHNGYNYSSYNYYGKKEYGYVKEYRRYYAANRGDKPVREVFVANSGLVHANGNGSGNGRPRTNGVAKSRIRAESTVAESEFVVDSRVRPPASRRLVVPRPPSSDE